MRLNSRKARALRKRKEKGEKMAGNRRTRRSSQTSSNKKTEVTESSNSRRREENRGIEENTLAILDSSGFNTNNNKDTQHLNDDRKDILDDFFDFMNWVSVVLIWGFVFSVFGVILLGLAFLEAVRSASIVPENGTAPTKYSTLSLLYTSTVCVCVIVGVLVVVSVTQKESILLLVSLRKGLTFIPRGCVCM